VARGALTTGAERVVLLDAVMGGRRRVGAWFEVALAAGLGAWGCQVIADGTRFSFGPEPATTGTTGAGGEGGSSSKGGGAASDGGGAMATAGSGGADSSGPTTSAGGGPECQMHGDCAPTGWCDAGSCKPTKVLGETCIGGYECKSGHCADERCCNYPCSQPCIACAASKTGLADGTCQPIAAGDDPDDDCPLVCNGIGSCMNCNVVPGPFNVGCPGVCNGGCTPDNTCLIKCTSASSCQSQTISCPGGMHCDVQCLAPGSCMNTLVGCPETFHCHLGCAADSACLDADLHCSQAGRCDTDCGAQGNACTGLVVTCGHNACLRKCAGTSFPTMLCGPSCNCPGSGC
jgi:hypothetical protein